MPDRPNPDLPPPGGGPGDGARMKAILVLAGAVAFAVAPFVVPEFSGFEAGQFPVPQDRPPVQPAGYAFGIWGLIYVWLLAHAGYGLFARAEATDWDASRPALIVSLAVGAAWLSVARVSPLWATVLIWVMLAGALLALLRMPARDRWLAQAPVAIYAGWLTAASWVSVGLALAGFGLTGPLLAALIAVPLAVAMAVVVQRMRPQAPEYGLTVIWALVAVVVANATSGSAVVAVAGVAGIIVMGLVLRPSLQPG